MDGTVACFEYHLLTFVAFSDQAVLLAEHKTGRVAAENRVAQNVLGQSLPNKAPY